MNEHRWDRIFGACGIGYVVLSLAGVFVAMGSGKTHNLTVSSSPADIANAIASPAGTGVWIGAYLELLSMGLFLVFAVWAAAKLGGGVLGSIARAAAVGNVAASVISLAIGDTVSYRAGHGLGLETATTLVTLNEAAYVGTWFLVALFLVAAGALALAAARRALGWSAIAIAVYILVFAAASFDNLGQFGILFAMAWIVCASIGLTRGSRARVGAPAGARA